MRHFYTDPLAAAWMAKHFGMVFETSDSGVTISSSLYTHAPNGHRFYIHPDSLHLLEPKNKDTGQDGDGEWCQYSDHYRSWESIATPHDCSITATTPVKIRQRNGIAFHWPEVEA